MKKYISYIFLALLLTVVSSSAIYAQYVDENFEYPSGQLIKNYGWVPISGIGINPIFVCEPGLEFDCYECVTGNAACMRTTGEDVYKLMTRSINTGSLYTSFLVNFQSAQSGEFFFHLSDSSGNNSEKIARVYAKSSGGNVALGLAKDNESPLYTPGQYLLNTTYLVVLKYEFVPGNDNDLVSLFVFSECAPQVEPEPTLGPTGVGKNDLTNAGKVVLQQGANSHSPVLKIDGICMHPVWDNGALPIELTSFTSSVTGRDVMLNWSTASELNNQGFEIERSSESGDWTKAGFVNGNGTSPTPNNYSFTENNINTGRYSYRLKQIDFNGNFEYFNLSSNVVIGVPASFAVSQNYPNPFNPSTKINYDLPIDGNVSLKLFDMSGKEVLSLVNAAQTSGFYTITLDASRLPSGVYFYRVIVDGESKNFVMTKKMMLVK